MKVALSVKNNMITQHFGHCDYFVVYNISEKEIISSTVIKNPPHKKGYLPKFLKENEVDVVITGGIGKMAADLLTELDIECYMNVDGEIQEVVNDFINGKLEQNQEPCLEGKHEA
ncbi:MAG: NifB/NifX family molybdenum-iron cluster-binding protein [Candidatus Izimaplasma sp.]|nr:NifB/NifX family molybdenum-iron cluster-binding protein [Candidatus Izimaplasma bacterium]